MKDASEITNRDLRKIAVLARQARCYISDTAARRDCFLPAGRMQTATDRCLLAILDVLDATP